MKILLIGASGLLGRKLLETSPYDIIPTYHKVPTPSQSALQLDITKPREIKSIVKKVKPTIIIHAASIGDIDYCQKHQKEAWNINVLGTKNIVTAAQENNCRLIFFSSNAVFDGKHPPYTENSPCNPINFYGETKLRAEKLIESYQQFSIIFRLTTMYGWNNSYERQNPATWLISQLKSGKKVPIVTDIVNNPLWVGQAAQSVWQAIEKNLFGHLFHIAGKQCISRYEFSQAVAEVFDLDHKLLTPVASNYFQQITKRPSNTCFSTVKMKRLLRIQPYTIKVGLKKMRSEQL